MAFELHMAAAAPCPRPHPRSSACTATHLEGGGGSSPVAATGAGCCHPFWCLDTRVPSRGGCSTGPSKLACSTSEVAKLKSSISTGAAAATLAALLAAPLTALAAFGAGWPPWASRPRLGGIELKPIARRSDRRGVPTHRHTYMKQEEEMVPHRRQLQIRPAKLRPADWAHICMRVFLGLGGRPARQSCILKPSTLRASTRGLDRTVYNHRHST